MNDKGNGSFFRRKSLTRRFMRIDVQGIAMPSPYGKQHWISYFADGPRADYDMLAICVNL